MGYRNMAECLADLSRHRQLVRVDYPIDPYLELAEVQRRLYARGGPVLLFAKPKGTAFPVVCNLFGSLERTRFLFRDAIPDVRKLVELKADPDKAKSKPWRYWNLPFLLWRLRPAMRRGGPILAHRTTLTRLPQIQCWPRDGGPFVTLPLVYTEDPERPGWAKSNLGMYRVQIAGNDYEPDAEVGMHYQIHRGIGVHHAAARKRNERLRVNVIVGGPPALSVAAVMPLPEGLPELAFAAALGGRRLTMAAPSGVLPMPAEADFVIAGSIDPTRTKPEGPFGDHLGYYSLRHDFPVMRVDAVYHRPGAVWPFTVVGRPPQEDTSFGEFIHDLTGPAIPAVLPGVKGVHAVDAAGVHPLLLAIGSERYVPYASVRRPQELLTQANAILGQGQLSLAKYLFIAAHEDDPALDVHDAAAFFRHILARADWQNDLHFQTRTTMDTLDYSAGQGLNVGSKVVVAAAGPVRRELARSVGDVAFPEGFDDARVALPGVLVVRGPTYSESSARRFVEAARIGPGFPLVVLVDDAEFVARTLNNFLWATFTRSNPASDLYGIGEFTHQKHWGCTGALAIDARVKPHHAPPLVEDAAVSARVDALAAKSGPLHGLI